MPRTDPVSRRETKRQKAREKLTDITDTRRKAEDRAAKARKKQSAFILRAHKAGLTYAELATITGLTPIRVAQILRAEREGA